MSLSVLGEVDLDRLPHVSTRCHLASHVIHQTFSCWRKCCNKLAAMWQTLQHVCNVSHSTCYMSCITCLQHVTMCHITLSSSRRRERQPNIEWQMHQIWRNYFYQYKINCRKYISHVMNDPHYMKKYIFHVMRVREPSFIVGCFTWDKINCGYGIYCAQISFRDGGGYIKKFNIN